MMTQASTVSAPERAHIQLMALVETDPQVAAAVPIETITRSIQEPGISYRDVISRTLAGYADRPALGMRAYELRSDGPAGDRRRHYLPEFSMTTYGELAHRIEAIASTWQHHPRHRVAPGEFVAFIAFTSAEMVTLDLACAYAQAIAVPLQANLPAPDMLGIFAETEPVTLVATIENLDLAIGYAREVPSVRSLVVIDADLDADDERERVEAARRALFEAGDRIALATLGEIVEFGERHAWTPPPRSPEGQDALVMLMFTSGSTGTPKGAMIHELMCNQLWNGLPVYRPTIQVVCAPLNHFMGRAQVFGTLAQGGTACFTLKSDMSTIFDDIRIARPITLMMFPRIAEIVYQNYQSEVQRRVAAGSNAEEAEATVKAEMKGSTFGDRLLSAGLAGSPTAPEGQDFLRECFGMALIDGYSSTEAGSGAIAVSGRIMRDTVIDYKLTDVPELGYYGTDKPYPRGELLLKSRLAIKGYFKRPEATAAVFDEEGWLHTGDIVEERGPDQVTWIGRRNNVLKLAQGEFVALGPLEATYLGHSALVAQIFLYGNSYRAFLLAVAVPDMDVARGRLGHEPGIEELRGLVLDDLQEVARVAGLKSFEVPRDVHIELEPFSHENGLLSSVRKPLHPKLKARYQDTLEEMYREMDRKQQDELARLRGEGSDIPLVERVAGALKSSLGLAELDPTSPQCFADLGGDSLGAVALSFLFEDLFGVAVPVSVILDPSGSAGRLADYIANALAGTEPDGPSPSFAAVHGEGARKLKASDLRLEAFHGPALLDAASDAQPPPAQARTVLLTGATGFLGRFLCIEWLENLRGRGGKLLCLVRATDAESGRARLDEAFGTVDPDLAGRFRDLAGSCLEVVPGDLAAPRLGLDEATFRRLAEEVDQVVHVGALVNHLLPYRNLFEPNVVGTAELLRLALSGRQKRFEYVSTFGVPQMAPGLRRAPEHTDIREAAPEIALSDSYANGYGASKWASEVLLREAHERFALPVMVYRPDMIMAHSRYRGQLNVPDMFTRLVLSLAMTGIAPVSFYERSAGGRSARAHYDGTPVDFLAAAIRELGDRRWQGFRTYNTISAHLDDGISLDTIAGWIETAGVPLVRIEDHADWLRRFSDRLRNLPDEQRQRSALPILDYVARPHQPGPSGVRNDAFVAAVRELEAGPEVPQLSEAYIHKYMDDLRALGLLG